MTPSPVLVPLPWRFAPFPWRLDPPESLEWLDAVSERARLPNRAPADGSPGGGPAASPASGGGGGGRNRRVSIPLSGRDWNAEFQEVMELPCPIARGQQLVEFSAQFQAVARQCAQTIVRESTLPASQVPTCNSTPVTVPL